MFSVPTQSISSAEQSTTNRAAQQINQKLPSHSLHIVIQPTSQPASQLASKAGSFLPYSTSSFYSSHSFVSSWSFPFRNIPRFVLPLLNSHSLNSSTPLLTTTRHLILIPRLGSWLPCLCFNVCCSSREGVLSQPPSPCHAMVWINRQCRGGMYV